jgi:hypothetical protein
MKWKRRENGWRRQKKMRTSGEDGGISGRELYSRLLNEVSGAWKVLVSFMDKGRDKRRGYREDYE